MTAIVDNMVDKMGNLLPTLISERANRSIPEFPHWLNDAVRVYLAHTVYGVPIRALARSRGQHPSTILRQVRRVELQRDNPLIDQALEWVAHVTFVGPAMQRGNKMAHSQTHTTDLPPLPENLDAEARRVLRRLRERGAVLAVAQGFDVAVIVRDTQEGVTERLGSASRSLVMSLALEGWIATDNPDLRIVRYALTASGRSKLADLMRDLPEVAEDTDTANTAAQPAKRQNLSESPLMLLSRRKERDGKPFLAPELMTAGERLREDFEIACLSHVIPAVWQGFSPNPDAQTSTDKAAHRVAQALHTLGPGLADVAYRTCCQLQGLEKSEQAMGWSARSGKVVLRIALQRLVRHYEDTPAVDALVG